jgi:hypothetical protein
MSPATVAEQVNEQLMRFDKKSNHKSAFDFLYDFKQVAGNNPPAFEI